MILINLMFVSRICGTYRWVKPEKWLTLINKMFTGYLHALGLCFHPSCKKYLWLCLLNMKDGHAHTSISLVHASNYFNLTYCLIYYFSTITIIILITFKEKEHRIEIIHAIYNFSRRKTGFIYLRYKTCIQRNILIID